MSCVSACFASRAKTLTSEDSSGLRRSMRKPIHLNFSFILPFTHKEQTEHLNTGKRHLEQTQPKVPFALSQYLLPREGCVWENDVDKVLNFRPCWCSSKDNKGCGGLRGRWSGQFWQMLFISRPSKMRENLLMLVRRSYLREFFFHELHLYLTDGYIRVIRELLRLLLWTSRLVQSGRARCLFRTCLKSLTNTRMLNRRLRAEFH